MSTLPPEKKYAIGRDCPVCCDPLPTLDESAVWSEHCRHRLHVTCLESWRATSELCPVCNTFRSKDVPVHPPVTWKFMLTTIAFLVVTMFVIFGVAAVITAAVVDGETSVKRRTHKENPRDPVRQAKNEQALSALDWSTIDASVTYVVIDDGEIVCREKSVHDVVACLPHASYDALLVGRPGRWAQPRPFIK